MKTRIAALLLTLVLLLPLVSSALPVYAMGDTPEFSGTSLTLENNITINFTVNRSEFLAAGFLAESGAYPQVIFTFRGETWIQKDYSRKGTANTWFFPFPGITAADMNEPVTATITGVKNGVRVTGQTITESVASYCRRALLAYSTSNPTLCNLIGDLLTYGEKSQIYFDRDTDSLVTSSFTPSQKAFGTKTNPTPVSIKNTAFATVSNPIVTWAATNLDLVDSVNLQFYFKAVETDGVSIEIRNESNELIASFTEESFEAAEGEKWRVCCDTITPDQMGDALFVTAYKNGEAVSNTLRYSIESYAADAIRKIDDTNLEALLCAMLNYGASAKAYVEEQNNAVKVKSPTLKSQLDAIPVATFGTSDNDLRQIVLDYYALQASVPWITRDAFTYVYTGSATKDMAANTIYCGMPYSSAAVGLYKFLDYYNEDTGVLNNVWGNDMGNANNYNTNPDGIGLGNHCASSIYWAWARISTTITFDQTKNMTPAKGVYPVGDYTIDTTKEFFEENYDPNDNLVEGAYNTRSICDDNGATKMYQAYAKLKPGDAVVSYYIVKSGSTYTKRHHTRLVKSVSVNTNSSGTTIYSSSSTITFYEQDSPLSNFTLNGQAAKHFGHGVVGTVKPISFYDLYQTGYIPVTCAELLHDCYYPEYTPAAVEAASAELSSAITGTVTLDKIGAKNVYTNYCIAKMTLSAEDASGEVIAQVCEYRRFNSFKPSLSNLASKLNGELYAGSFTVYLDVLLSNGETVRVFTYNVSKS